VRERVRETVAPQGRRAIEGHQSRQTRREPILGGSRAASLRRDGLPGLVPFSDATTAGQPEAPHDAPTRSPSAAAASAAPIIPASLPNRAGTISARLRSSGPKCFQFSVTPPPMMNTSGHSSAW